MRRRGRGLKVLVAVLVVAVLAGGGVLAVQQYTATTQAAQETEQTLAAQQAQAAVYSRWSQLSSHAQDVALTVTEQGTPVGSYSLTELGLWDGLQEQIDQQFSQIDRLPPEDFAALSPAEQRAWTGPAGSVQLTMPLSELELSAVWADLDSVPRQAAQSAQVTFADGAYQMVPEVAGTELDKAAVAQLLQDQLAQLTLDEGGLTAVSVELTDCACYLPPEVTLETLQPDYEALLTQRLSALAITVDFRTGPLTLSGETLARLLTVQADGRLQVSEYQLRQQVDVWAQEQTVTNEPYLLDSYVAGPVAIDFLTVDYQLDREGLVQNLRQQLYSLSDGTVEVPYTAYRYGEPFSLGEEYVEVDMDHQVMTYYKDGEVLVTTDIVTGASWRSPTPEGLYEVENKAIDCWLSGADYCVFVDYWIGFISIWYGIHDADWRTEFGGDEYLLNGSHGCVNTPKPAVEIIYENIDLGVPVLVYGGV